ncbi:MAG: hypothetical protein ACE5GW_05755, partial [Planctomycetota bacterium]
TITGRPVGVKYAYRIRSTAESLGETPFPAGQDEKLSGESDPVLLPPDEVWKATGTNPSAIDAGGNIVPGRSMVIRISWDYAKGKRAIQRGVFTESPRNQKGEDIFGSGWYLDRVVPKGEGKPEHEVLLRRLDGSRERMTLVNNSNPLPLDPSGYSAPEEPEGAEAGAGKPEERAAAEEPEETEPPPDDGAGGLFGDD